MNCLKEYNIKLTDLKNNKSYNYDYVVEREFFNFFENEEIRGGKVDVKSVITKNNSDLIIEIRVSGKVILICDRCLGEYEQPVFFEDNIFAKEMNEQLGDKSDIVYLGKNATEINISRFIYDSVLLSLPIKRVHLKDKSGHSTCNMQVIAKINKYIINSSEIEED